MSIRLRTINVLYLLKLLLSVVVISSSLIACGSSSGGGDDPDPESSTLTASAGSSVEALELSTVILDGTLSSDSDGSIDLYQWKQVSNGALSLTLTNSDSSTASFTLPVLSNDQDFIFQLTVTDNDGNTDQEEVTITGRPTPGISVSEVSGNTASLNSAAEFSVQLRSRPSLDVVIPLSSTDESEGIPEQTQLVFTPENWNQAQTAVIRGQNSDVLNGTQDYQIILANSQSADSFYNNIQITDIALKGIALEVLPPQELNALVSDIEATINPEITYTGSSQLSFSLTVFPIGMTIDLSSGLITWTPAETDEGLSFNVTVSVNDGSRFSESSFQVTVVQPVPITTDVQGNVLTVTEQDTSISGLSITQLDSAVLSELNLEKVPSESVPQIPTWIAQLTDIFLVKQKFDNDIELKIPLNNFPVDLDLRDINLYSYTEADGYSQAFWSSVFVNIRFEGDPANRFLIVSLGGLKGMYFFGVKSLTQPIDDSSSSQLSKAYVAASTDRALRSIADVNCQAGVDPNDGVSLDYRNQVCTYTGEDIEITVRDFGNSAGSKRWNGATIETLIDWLSSAQTGFNDLGLGFDLKFNVVIEPCVIEGKTCLGYVTTGNSENRKTLHITDANEAFNTIKGTAVHEYFHHAQGHSDTLQSSSTLLIDTGNSSWFIEGSARWFEDELFDSINTYVKKEGGKGSKILEQGLNSANGNGTKRPYQRFSFIKLLSSKCSNFSASFKSLLNVDTGSNDNGISSLSTELQNASCDFGNHLGAESIGSLKSALVYYQYSTLFENKISLLDSDESNSDFTFRPTTYQFDQTFFNIISQWLDITDDIVHKLNNVSNIPAAGAYSFKVPAIAGELPEGKVAELVVESNREVIVSVTSSDTDFVGTNTIGTHAHTWFSTANQTSYIYDAAGTVPEIFVTLVNPSIENSASVDVFFKIVDELNVDTIITSHITGDQVSNRVVTISGSIPEEARGATSKVVITANGIATSTTLNNDGSFAADIVVSLGDNIIKAQGFSGATPITIEEVITIQGVASAFTGLNALISSRAVFVLRWDTATDLDIYTTDKNDGTIWYSDKTEGPGNLDVDDTSGFGPEVVSYRATSDDVYVNGTFDVDVHYYSGSPSTNYTLDVVLNETEGSNRRSFKFESTTPHTISSSSEDSPTGSGTSRFNNILRVSCSSQRICTLTGFDSSKLTQPGIFTTSARANKFVDTRKIVIAPSEVKFASSYEQCESEFNAQVSKSGSVEWYCNQDGTKQWY